MCRERKTGRWRERETTMSDPERESDVVLVSNVLLMSCDTAVLYLIYLDSEQVLPVSPGDLDPFLIVIRCFQGKECEKETLGTMTRNTLRYTV